MPALYIAQELPSLTETSSLHNLIPHLLSNLVPPPGVTVEIVEPPPHMPPPPPHTPGNEEKTKFLKLGPPTKKGPGVTVEIVEPPNITPVKTPMFSLGLYEKSPARALFKDAKQKKKKKKKGGKKTKKQNGFSCS
jgi:hypothetical protein